MQFVELGAVTVEFVEQRDAIGQTDVAPHFRMARGNPREIAKTARRVGKQQVVVVAQRQIIDQREREQMRQMADRGEYSVVVLRVEFVNQRAAPLPRRPYARDIEHGILGQGREHKLLVAVKIGASGASAAIFRAGDRVRRNELGDPFAEGGARHGNDVGLGAAAIGHHRFRPQIRRNARHDLRHLTDRRRDQHQVGISDFLPGVGADAVDDAKIERLRQRRQTATKTDDLLDLFGGLEPERKRTADQADAKNYDLAEFRLSADQAPHQRACVLSSASRKRRFSASVPIVTRSHSGMP